MSEIGPSKEFRYSRKAKLFYSSLQALCYALNSTDYTRVWDDGAMVAQIRDDVLFSRTRESQTA